MKFAIVILFFVINLLSTENLQKVSLQLQWFNQFQFAGYYIAKEKGFYKNVGLDVNILTYKSCINPVDKVSNTQANYATGRSSLIIDRSKGKNVVLLSAILQSSPMVLAVKKLSNIKSIEDFKGKRLMLTGNESTVASLQAVLKSKKVSFDDLIFKKSINKFQEFIDGEADIISIYTSNQAYKLKKQGIEIDIFDPKDYGFEFYSDLLFTNENEIIENKQRTINFRDASLRGWKWAFDNIEASVDIILEKYNSQNKSREALIYEANELKKLAYFNTKQLGQIDINKIQRLYDVYNLMGFVDKKIDLDKFIFQPSQDIIFTKEEQEYLENKKILNMCIDPDWMPFEKMENGKHIGLASDYIKIIREKIDIPIKLVETKDWDESIQKAKNRECDIFSMVPIIEKRKKYMNFTSPYLDIPMVIATTADKPFIDNIRQILDKKIGVVTSYSIGNTLRESYPHINIVNVESISDGLKKLETGEIFAFVDNLATINYEIQKNFIGIIKISGRLDKRLKYRVASRNDEPILNNILEKIITDITLAKKQEIFNRWVMIKKNRVDYVLLFEVLAGVLIIFLFLLYRQNQLNKHNKELKRHKKLYQLVFENSANGVLMLDIENYKFLDCNHQIVQMLKYYSKDEILNLSPLDLSPPFQPNGKSSEVEIKNMINLAVQNGSNSFEWKNLKATGEEFWAEIILTKIKIDNKEMLHIVWKDIDDKKNAEEALKELSHSLELRVKEEVGKNREKDKKMLQQAKLAQMGEMLSMIAHQWRQPLTAINATSIGLNISARFDELEAKNVILKTERISEYAQHLSSTIEDFRNFFKANKDKKLTNYGELINSVMGIVEVSLGNKNIKLIKELNCPEKFKTYPNEVKQVILNLIKNAEDAITENKIENPQIKILTYKEDDKYIFEVNDNGGGVPEELIEKIFDPYFSTKTKKDGTGLGLYMSKTIIEEHCNGTLTVSNNEEGAVFKITL